MSRLADQRGFTLIELLVGMAVGMVVLLGAFQLLDTVNRETVRVSQRVDTTERGRIALEQITRSLKSQTCLSQEAGAIAEAGPDSVTFYASLREPTVSGVLPVDRRVIAFVPDGAGGTPERGRLVERVFTPTGTPPDLVFPATPTTERTLAEGVSRGGTTGTDPIFTYSRYDPAPLTNPAATPALIPLPAGGDRNRIVQTEISFTAFPERSADRKLRTDFRSAVLSRTADANDPDRSPKCI